MKKSLILLIAALLLCACVPTPEEEFVTHKDADEMLAKADGGERSDLRIREQYAIPETVTQDVSEADGHFALQIDAHVEVPDTNAIPILRAERDTFSQETVTAIFQRLCADRTMVRGGDGAMTKEQIAKEIAQIEEELNDPSLDADTRTVMQDRIAMLKALYPSAPDTRDERQISDGTFYSEWVSVIAGEPEQMRYGLRLQTDDSLPVLHFTVYITDPDNPNTTGGGRDALKNARLSFHDDRTRALGGEGQTAVFLEDPQQPDALQDFPQVTYLPAQAVADAQRFLQEIGQDSFVPDAVQLVFDGTQSAYGYRIECVRTYEGIPTVFLRFGTWLGANEQYVPNWDYERMTLCIDEQGVYLYEWEAPIRITDTIRESAALQPFDAVLTRFAQQLYAQSIPWVTLDPSTTGGDEDGWYTSDLSYTVTRITLSLQRVMEPNRFDSGMLVPVWNFWGTKHETETNLNTGAQRTIDTRELDSLLSINAIDGSVIDPAKGY